MQRKKINAAIFLVALVLFALFIFNYFLGKLFNSTMNTEYQEISLEEAKNQPDLKVYDPAYLPEGMVIEMAEKIVKPKKDMPTIILTISNPSKKEVDTKDEITISQVTVFGEEGGLEDGFLKRFENVNLKYTHINGIKARVMSFKKGSDMLNIYFRIDKTAVDITGRGQGINEEELIKVAESMIPKD